MQIETTKFSEVLVLTPKVFADDRGFFMESFNKDVLFKAGIKLDFVQDNHSKSVQNVLRGLHFQSKFPQGKLIRVLSGSVLDVFVDIRKDSSSFGEWDSVELSSTNKKQVWVPPGFAHGFSVLSETAEFMYKVTDYWHPEDEKGICFNDPQLKIDWKILKPILSPKDSQLPLLKDMLDILPPK